MLLLLCVVLFNLISFLFNVIFSFFSLSLFLYLIHHQLSKKNPNPILLKTFQHFRFSFFSSILFWLFRLYFVAARRFRFCFFLKKIYLKKYLADDKIKISFSQKCLQKFSITFLVMYERRSFSTQMTALLFILAGMCFLYRRCHVHSIT